MIMSIKSSVSNDYNIKNKEKHVLWAHHSFENHH